METILMKVTALALVIVLSYMLKQHRFFRVEDFKVISNIVLKITLPCAVISNFNRIDVNVSLFSLILTGVFCNLLTIGFRHLVAIHKRYGGVLIPWQQQLPVPEKNRQSDFSSKECSHPFQWTFISSW